MWFCRSLYVSVLMWDATSIERAQHSNIIEEKHNYYTRYCLYVAVEYSFVVFSFLFLFIYFLLEWRLPHTLVVIYFSIVITHHSSTNRMRIFCFSFYFFFIAEKLYFKIKTALAGKPVAPILRQTNRHTKKKYSNEYLCATFWLRKQFIFGSQ